MHTSFEHIYNIGDIVYYNLPDSEMFIITDIQYSVLTKKAVYTLQNAGNIFRVYDF